MKKYLYIFKSELMSNLQYAFNLLTGFISCFLMLFIFLNLWQYMYSDPNELINGYNMFQMIWYVIITEIIYMSVRGRQVCRDISNDIKSGNIAYNLNKPYDYILYALSNHLGKISVRFFIYGSLGILTGILFLHKIPNLNLLSIIIVFISTILAIIVNLLFTTLVGLLSFFVEDSGPFFWIYSKFILLLGTIFPIEYFPGIIGNILKFTPIFAMSYGPAKLFVDFSYSNMIPILISQIIYLIIGYILCKLLYKKGVKNLNVNGG